MKKSTFPCGHSMPCPVCATAARKRIYTTSGRCYECGKAKSGDDHLRCISCRDKANRRRKRLEEGRIANDNCHRCGAPLDGDSTSRCTKCLTYAAKWFRQYAAKKRRKPE